ncbi:NAD-dependent epimerase/dehydratase family protein [Nonomuraea zeae]|uniref:NAD-dependent epimerase/dehydratase family protein n=1 Tax=Nonomuraea zeae TaxID=1642303 RepID=A0A5S4FGC9_9ACTN|nr:NAD-dependent epimerase/dehydratase family protein [Nonomuraea zeae]TMR17508.1 NAD-dependent epimerase/dehydratase family protein [Nonomuraea zeae]
MSLHVIVGAGATGSALARHLADQGEQVRLVTRRGGGPVHPLIERRPADASDAARLTELAAGAAVLFNCAMPPYDRWPAEWPPLAAALLSAAERGGADYVMLGNTYGYGPIEGSVVEGLPMAPTSRKGQVRAKMWHDARAAHEAGRLRVTEVRASDFLGAGAYSPFTLMVGAQVLAGGPAAYPGDLDVAHSWTYTGDAARTLIAAARHEESWGRAWHVPSTSEISVRHLAGHLAAAADTPAPRLRHMPSQELEEIGRTDSIMAEFPEMLYLYDRPNILDASSARKVLGVTPTPIDDVLREMAAQVSGASN